MLIRGAREASTRMHIRAHEAPLTTPELALLLSLVWAPFAIALVLGVLAHGD
jgi:hypothetical protein